MQLKHRPTNTVFDLQTSYLTILRPTHLKTPDLQRPTKQNLRPTPTYKKSIHEKHTKQ